MPTVASFYSGAGGFDLGFKAAGYDIIFANDIDPIAIDTYTRHSPETYAVAQDINALDISRAHGADVVIGGPPCQGFSVAGKMDIYDPRSKHVSKFMDIVSEIKPRVFVMENVKNLYTNTRWSGLRQDLINKAQELGYQTKMIVLNAADFGVAQNRERMFFIGVYGDRVLEEFTIPHTAPISVREALAELPPYQHVGNFNAAPAKITLAKNPVLRRSPYAGMLFNGGGRPIDLDRLAPTLPASMGGNRTPIIEQSLLDGSSESWVQKYHKYLTNGGTPNNFYIPIKLHLRRLTVEEATVLQGFDAGMEFCGPITAQYRQIGNSVAPPVAQAIATYIKENNYV